MTDSEIDTHYPHRGDDPHVMNVVFILLIYALPSLLGPQALKTEEVLL